MADAAVIPMPMQIAQTKGKDRRSKRRILIAQKAETEALYSRQVAIDLVDPFEGFYAKNMILKSPYSFPKLYRVFEESDILQTCIDSMVNNVDGFGYEFKYMGDDIKDKETPEAQAVKEELRDFFSYVNDQQSFTSIRKLMRTDLEVLGNGGFEVIRNNVGRVQMLFHAPFINMRLTVRQKDPVTIMTKLPRNGKLIDVEVKRHFRKFVQLSETGKTLRWFKEFGDPRPMSSKTGDYNTRGDASEIWHFKIPFAGSAYGLPRYIGAMLEVLGRRNAQYVNYDLFESQGIPPFVVLVSGGTLTDESFDELDAFLEGLRGTANFNKATILEATPESIGLEDKGTAKVELKSMTDFRKDDAMFTKYTEGTEKNIRHRYRLPDLYVGASETFTHATAKAAQVTVEEQVFTPERQDFDEVTNMRLIRGEFGITDWQIKTKGPKVVGAQDIVRGVEVFSKIGALSVNHAIDRANEAFNLDMSKFKEPWAEYPLPMVLELLKAGRLEGIDEIASEVIDNATQMPGAGTQSTGTTQPGVRRLLLPGVKRDMVGAEEVFTDTEKQLYAFFDGLRQFADEGCGHEHQSI